MIIKFTARIIILMYSIYDYATSCIFTWLLYVFNHILEWFQFTLHLMKNRARSYYSPIGRHTHLRESQGKSCYSLISRDTHFLESWRALYYSPIGWHIHLWRAEGDCTIQSISNWNRELSSLQVPHMQSKESTLVHNESWGWSVIPMHTRELRAVGAPIDTSKRARHNTI